MVRYCDSIEDYFTLEKRYNNYGVYEKIEVEVGLWKFGKAGEFMRSCEGRFRATDWFYTFAQVLRFPRLLAIDIDTIILCMRKMRITSYDSPSY